ncbi:bifunctional diguanylate cyclase/phosphodiesterase [Gallaecimonas sp. GXIMD4217]|uniref:putative bifunctional diguanylate cyclase/phosphodiesterase n=1 Tax=Gallaecimonas sp. GXIMD4217 TaxID=3131927 RepID=UPI00311AD76F
MLSRNLPSLSLRWRVLLALGLTLVLTLLGNAWLHQKKLTAIHAEQQQRSVRFLHREFAEEIRNLRRHIGERLAKSNDAAQRQALVSELRLAGLAHWQSELGRWWQSGAQLVPPGSAGWAIDCRDDCLLVLEGAGQGQPWVAAVPLTAFMAILDQELDLALATWGLDDGKAPQLLGSSRSLPGLAEVGPYLDLGCLSDGLCDGHPDYLLLTVNQSLMKGRPIATTLVADRAGFVAEHQPFLYEYLAYGALVVLISGGLLLLVLHPPLQRISATGKALPLLAEADFDRFRSAMRAISHKQRLRDETSQLSQLLEVLSYRLESMETQLQRRAGELEWLANHDVLTGLVNRRRFEQEMQQLLRQQSPASLLFMDLDNFKFVNDVAGHKVGDRLLVRVAKALRQVMPVEASVARFGGDEFAVMVPGITIEQEEELLSRVYHAFREVRVSGGGQLHSPSMSVGLARIPEDGDDFDDLMARVDMAMYRAKELGKNRHIRVASVSGGQELGRQLFWLERSKHALDEINLCLYFQPIVHTESRQVVHYEVLLRVKDRDGALCSPVELIRAAEQTGQTTAIDLWVFRRLVAELEALGAPEQTRFAINLSPKTFGEGHVIDEIAQALQDRPEVARRLIFEITETAAFTNLLQARQSILRLKALGCQFALDDFGVGFSSFHTLKALPVDFIKIDGSFIRDLASKDADSIFIRALVDIADQFGYRTIAEYVEDEEVAELLGILQVSYMQGYLFGRPQPAQRLWPATEVA